MTKIRFLILALFVSAGIYGQDKKISELPGATTPADSADKFVVVQSGTTKQIDFWDISQTSFPVDVRTNGAGLPLFESFWLGEDAGINHTTAAWYNYGIGTRAHYGLTSGVGNTALGFNSGFSLTTGSGNHYVGLQSGYSADTSRYNVGIGYQSLYGANGYGNIGIGYKPGYVGLDGEKNVFIGWQSARQSGDADHNVGLGTNSLYALTTGDYNIGIGAEALSYVTIGSNSIGIGRNAADSMSTGSVLAIGAYAGQSTTGARNTLIGENAAIWLKAGTNNSVLGYQAMQGSWGTAGDDNSIFGAYAGNDITTGDDNTLIGSEAGSVLTTHGNNVAIGSEAMKSATGTNSIAIGYQAGLSNTATGSVFIGYDAGGGNTSGVNTSLGYMALRTETTGTQNTAVGYQSMQASDGANYNSTLGYHAGTVLSTGDGNTFMGHNAGDAINSGSNNVFIGYDAGGTSNTATGSIKIGYMAGGVDNSSNVLFIENSASATPLIWGDFAEDSLIFNGTLDINDATNGRGITFGGDYSPLYVDLSATDKLYQDTHLGGQDLNSTVYDPGEDEDGAVITWDDTEEQFVMTDVVDVGSAAGVVLMAFDTILYTDDASQENIVALPVGAVVWDIRIHVYTEFDGGGTDLLDIGTTGDGDHYTNDLNVGVSGGTWPTMTLLLIPSRISGTTNVTFRYDDSDNDATQGMAFIYVQYSIQ